MSIARCDTCQKLGRRRFGHMCPTGWFYTESTDNEEGPESTIVSMFCSRKCAEDQIKEGPGSLPLAETNETC